MPRSQFSQMSRHRSPTVRVRQRGLLGQQAEQRVLDRGPQRGRQVDVGDPVRDQSGARSRYASSWSCPISAASDRHAPGVVAQQVADRAAVRVRAGQRGQVPPGHHAVGLRAEPGQHAGVGEPVVGSIGPRAAGAELRLDRHPADVRRLQGAADDVADLAVVDAERGGHRQGREDLALGRAARSRVVLDPAQVGAAVVPGRLAPTHRRTAGRPRPGRGAAVSRSSRSSSRAIRTPLELIRIRTIGRAASASSSRRRSG